MPAAPPSNTLSTRATALVRRIGVPSAVLFAALLFDIVYTTQAALDDLGPRFVDFGLLPCIFAMAACGLWAQKRAAVAGVVGGGVLIFSTLFIHTLHIPPYSSVLPKVTITEVVAGVLMVYYVARRARAGVAFCVVGFLVVAGLVAVFGRYGGVGDIDGGTGTQALLFGLLLLVGPLVPAIAARDRGPRADPRTRRLRRVNELAMGQWPLMGLLGFALLFEFGYTYSNTARGFPILFCSILAAVIAVLSPRRPADALLGLAGIMLLSAIVTPFLQLHSYDYPVPGGIPATQIVAGMGVVVNLTRARGLGQSWRRVAVLSSVVALGAILNSDARRGLQTDPQVLSVLAFAATLMLGISIAVGLMLRSRDSERTQAVQSAVSDAQTAERMALARELHDIVAHHVTGIVVQAQAARLMAEKNPQIAVDAMGRIENAGVEALAAMRRLVRSMRGDAPAGSSEFSEQATTDLGADLRKLVDSANHGVPTSMHLDLPPDLPHEVGRSALRLVQESLTNVGKHAADATEAFVAAEVRGVELHLRVTDNGRATVHRPAGGSGGYGLVGMRERVALLKGRLSAGRGPDGGWRVEAWLPLAAGEDTEGDE
ncbi:two-component system histidine kinase [Amycolatopsis mediterranei S699]|uniref:histidine kinase n=2 Tax=Amycolatopsis mediterranei TaxID=33910 RepID=A0A0H3DMP6_AMYMU|nr:histidine kinase [Amycolatopsis mediterranei]ADJ50959.1 two-component system histidine kinase [Amycolatopsis mediterranei U32]AEK47974.1 two-component system histidine kinase [Amycolatopsis mediterranei S699]AFO82665.1 two-component system histidine kinase [Amycolatopsis mediterranei S699]AGT89794.1 two-component system histidine kinase [Amycolatopsis mediterranei RB]KDO12047.1 histidine kinase [Amycolatopsis mediterranei]